MADGRCPRARARRALPSGDERAFQELVDRYKDLVFALIARTVQDRSRAEDLAQDVFLRIHRGLPYFRGEARLSTWIYRIVANVCLQDHGASARDRRRSTTSATRTGRRRRRPIGSSAISSCAIGSRKRSRGCRRTTGCSIAAHYLQGVQYEELAEALQLPLGTVKTQLYRAKQQLRRLLETDLR